MREIRATVRSPMRGRENGFPRVRVGVSPSPFKRGHSATPRSAARFFFQLTGRSVLQLTRRSRSLRSLRNGALPHRRDGSPSAPPRAPLLDFARCAGTSAARPQHALISKCRRRRRGRFSSCKSNPPRRNLLTARAPSKDSRSPKFRTCFPTFHRTHVHRPTER